MTEFFLRLVNMSISAGWIVLAVLALRFLLKKAPKWITVLLWGIVGIRLVCPFTVESVVSLIPSAETISPEIMLEQTPAIQSGVSFINQAVNPVIGEATISLETEKSVNLFQFLLPYLAVLWLAGVAVLLLYTLVSYLRLKGKVAVAVRLRDNVFQSENVASPFVLGFVRPRIYLPFGISEGDADHVIAHENAHIRRGDHLWKPLGFLLLTLHWFNPLLWLGYVLLCRDIELACDEKVICDFGAEQKADYSQALLSCSVNRRVIAACPLAFGEVGVKDRVKSVLHYKKPAFWIIVLAVLACILTAVCFLTSPKTELEGELSVFVDMQIVEHNSSNSDSEGVFSAVHHKVLGIDRSLNQTTVYLWSMYQEYSLENGVIREGSGSHIPVVITAKRTGKHGHYELVEYWQPRDGSYYVKDIREKFPWYLEGKALDSQRYVKEQEEFCRKAAEEAFADAISGVGGTDDPSEVSERVDGHPSLYAKVLEVYENSILVEAIKDGEGVKAGQRFSVSTNVTDQKTPLPKLEVGSKVLVVHSGEIQETYPMQIGKVYAIYNESELSSSVLRPVATVPEVLSEPPVAVVVSNEQSIETQKGTFSWIYKDEKGNQVALAADGVHPLTAKKTMPRIDILPSYASYGDPLGAYVSFHVKGTDPICQVPPDEIRIRAWKEEDWGNTDADAEEIDVSLVNGNRFFTLKDGNYVYEVIAKWKSNGSFEGTARYAFYTAKPDLDWNSYPKIGENSRAQETFLRTETDAIKETYDKEEFVVTKTYHRMDDGLWVWQSYGYLYRLELTGKGYGSEKNSTYLVLSNRKDVTFEEVWKAEFSSNTEDFFDPRETVVVARKIWN